MRYNVLCIGVGGEGVLTAATMIARAANYDGYYVRGVQLHGLAQRGGSIPTFVRFGDKGELSSPGIMQGDANLVLAFEPLEAVRATYYARKEKTIFVINDFPHMPVYANLLNLPYPKIDEIKKRVKPFAKQLFVFDAHSIAKERFGEVVLGNTIVLGFASRFMPIKRKSWVKAIKASSPRMIKENLEAFRIGENM
ncbi:MAG: indolepyruvate oxidoreductase subunit beta [Candidatus Diapherotrites archaeon]|nr:indolepyruvate oxidoreductase subunit beta [Candidatus Diapherotrites archaeon]